MNSLASALIASMLLLSFGHAQLVPAASTPLSGVGLQQDVRILRSALEQPHPGLYRYRTRAEMDADFAELEQDFSHDQTLEQAFLRLTRFTATIRCGHTYPSFFNQSDKMAKALFERPGRLPFFYRWIDRRMIVTRDFTLGHSLPAGTEVLGINGIASATLLDRMMPLARADGANEAKRIDTLQLQGSSEVEAPDVYLPLLVPGWGDSFRLQVKRFGAHRSSLLKVPGVSFAGRQHEVRSGRPDPAGTEALFTLRYTQGGAALLTMPTWVMYHSKWDWKRWLNDALDEVIARESPALIVDLRGNEGGDDVGAVILARLVKSPGTLDFYARLVRYRRVPDALLPYLKTWDDSVKDWKGRVVDLAEPWPTAPPVPYLRQIQEDESAPAAAEPERSPKRFEGRVFVLTDASNSSATYGFARIVQEQHLGRLVGEPTGGNRRGTNGGSFFFLRLPYSAIEVDLPLIGYFPETAQPDSGLVPDILIRKTQRDIAHDVDPVLEQAVLMAEAGRLP